MILQVLSLFRKAFTFKRLWHIFLSLTGYGLSLLFRRPIVLGMPPVVMIEPASICNLRCPLCPSGNGTLSRPRGFMDMSLYHRIIDQIAPTATMVILWNQGESFLHPQFFEMIRYASQKGLITWASTNMNVDFDARQLVRSGLDNLIVSVDGSSQESYNRYRINGLLERVLQNTSALRRARVKAGSRSPRIVWQCIVMRHNEHEIEDIRALAEAFGADSLQLKTVQIITREDVKNYLPRNPAYSRYRIQGDDFTLRRGVHNRCRRLWTQPVIDSDGVVVPCCFDKDADFPMGNVNRQSIREIWHGTAFQRMRKIILTRRKSIPMCLNCGEGTSLEIRPQ